MISSIRSSALISPSTMWRRFCGLVEAVLRTTGDDLDLMLDVGHEGATEIQCPGHATNQGNHVDAETRLERGRLPEVVEHDLRDWRHA